MIFHLSPKSPFFQYMYLLSLCPPIASILFLMLVTVPSPNESKVVLYIYEDEVLHSDMQGKNTLNRPLYSLCLRCDGLFQA